LTIPIRKLTDEDLWNVYSDSIKELKKRGLVRSKNITGERGEAIAIAFYGNTKNLPKLQAAPVGTKNVDAISKNGERYSIKTIVSPNKTSGVFYGMGTPDQPIKDKKFEYLIIVLLGEDYQPLKMIEVDWDIFYKFKKWHSRMSAFNISLSKKLLDNGKVLFARS